MPEHLHTAGEAGLFARVGAPEDRLVRGPLLPYGELSSLSVSNTEPIQFARGTVTVPADPMVVGLNRDHDRFDPIGRAVALEDTEGAVVATFAIATTPEGDAFLADPTRRRLSPELRGIVRDPADRSRGVAAVLVGAGAVEQGAFASAGLFAIGAVTDAAPPAPATDPSTPATPAGAEADHPTTTSTPEPPAPAGTPTTAGAPAESEAIVPEIPESVAEQTAEQRAEQLGANAVFAAVAAARAGDASAETMLGALADIKHTGTGALPAAGVLQPAWLGEVWSGRAYVRKYIQLGTTGTIQGVEAKGYRLDQGTALVKAWGGNKAELPTGTATTAVVTSTLRKYGFAADIAREFFDLPGGAELVEAFMRGVVNSYARITDNDALADIVTAAGAAVAPAVYPTGYPKVMGQIIQGIELVEAANDTPTFAIVNTLAWRELLYTPRDQVPEFVKFGVRTDGQADADGTIRIVRGAIGINNTPATIVGSSAAIRFMEPAGASPIQLDALDIARGGVDRAVVGYMQTLVEYPQAIVKVGTADV